MEFIISKTAGNDEFHQELIDLLNQKYQDFHFFINELIENDNELYIKRHVFNGYFSFSVSIIDFNNDIITIDWINICNK